MPAPDVIKPCHEPHAACPTGEWDSEETGSEESGSDAEAEEESGKGKPGDPPPPRPPPLATSGDGEPPSADD